jgi:tetratricopeptide (TPR) repeat protein
LKEEKKVKKVLMTLLFLNASFFFSLFAGFIYAQDSAERLGPQHSPYCITSQSDIDLLLEMAQASLEAKKYKQVTRLCESVLQRDKLNKEAHFLLGIAHHYLGEHDLAVEKLQWVLLIDKDNAVAREYLDMSERKSISQCDPQEISLIKTAIRYHEQGLNGLAISTLKEALKRNQENTETWELLGDIYKELGNPTIAKALYHRANAQEKARGIKGEARAIPEGWAERLSEKETKLYKANLRFVELRDQATQIRRRLTELDISTRNEMLSEIYAQYLSENILGMLEEERLKLQEEHGKVMTEWSGEFLPSTFITYATSKSIDKTKELKENELKIEETRTKIDESKGKKLALSSEYYGERSKTEKELETKTKELIEARASIKSLEEELRSDTLK